MKLTLLSSISQMLNSFVRYSFIIKDFIIASLINNKSYQKQSLNDKVRFKVRGNELKSEF